MSFDDKVIIVSGGASGTGRATASLLGAAGANVVIADIDGDAGARVAATIGPNATLVETDLRSLDAIESLVAQTEVQFGKIDGLANVAAVYPFTLFLDTTEEVWQEIEEVNLRGTFFLALGVAKVMIRHATQGAIVNVASGAAFRPVPGMAAYSATKGGVVAMSRTMAQELAPHHIRVNVVAPGHIASETALSHMTHEQMEEIAAPLVGGRFMTPEEVAEAIVFLLGESSRAMTGAALNVNLGNFMPH
jgi:NAD(P)-dependent dehydrogenase (short-subunit alcohol dehydrogenase family)